MEEGISPISTATSATRGMPSTHRRARCSDLLPASSVLASRERKIVHSAAAINSGSRMPLALHSVASAVHNQPPASSHHRPEPLRPSSNRRRPTHQQSRPQKVKVAGSIASRCTIYSVVETNKGCSSQKAAPSSAAVPACVLSSPACVPRARIAQHNSAPFNKCSRTLVTLNQYGFAGQSCALSRDVKLK